MFTSFHSTLIHGGSPRMNWSGLLPLLIASCLVSFRLLGAESATAGTGQPADAEAAWAEVQRLQAALRARPEWQGREPKPEQLAAFQSTVLATALDLARQARAFATRFPTNENAGDARCHATMALCRAVAAGDSASEEELKRFVAATLADLSIPEDDRVSVLLVSGNLAVMKKLGMKEYTERLGSFAAEREESTTASAREVIRQFPKNSKGYWLLLVIAERAKGKQQKELAREILALDGASKAVKSLALHVLNGTRPYRIGRPLDIQFTALDGREVDLRKLKGKVVLIEFWATDCGPCVAETPNLKAAYEKFHSDGFEIIGISLDYKESALRRFTREKELPWPQYFDGKGWEHQFGLQYGIFVIPTMWLVDRRGNLRFTGTRFNLEEEIKPLIAKKP
jgi:peroxiredoxin